MHLFSQKLTPTPTPLTGHQVSPGCQTARSDGCHMAHSDGAIWHTPLVPYGTHDRCKSIEKNLPFSMIFRHSDGAIWHTPLVPYGTHDRCHMATGTLGVCHYGGTWCPSVAGGGGEFFVSDHHIEAREPPGKVRRTFGCWRHRLFFFPLEASCQNRGGGPGDSRTPGCRTRCLLQPPGVLGPGERCPPGGPGPGDSWSPGVPDHRLLVPGAVPGPGPWFLMSGVGGGGGFRARTPGSAIFS